MERELLTARLAELDRLADERNILKCSDFLSYAEQDAYHRLERQGAFRCGVRFLSGGFGDAERARAFFLPDYMDRENAEAQEICAIRAEALNDKFADALTHRDFLGALMNLGIERECLGDILVEGSSCLFFCKPEVSEHICRNLLRVKHTSVRCETVSLSEISWQPRLEEMKVNVASERIDAVLAAIWKLSRQKAAQLVEAEQVFVNGMTAASAGRTLKEGDRVSVRGFGKFIYDGIGGSSRKGRLYVAVRRFM